MLTATPVRAAATALVALGIALAAACPAAAQSPPNTLRAGVPVIGNFTDADPTLDDGSSYADYIYTGKRGETVTITLRSRQFDAYLHLGRIVNGEWDSLAEDDDGAGDTDAQIDFELPADGEYIVRANTLFGGERGTFTLQLVSGAAAPPAAPGRDIFVCVLQDGDLHELDVRLLATGDTLVAGVPFRQVHALTTPPYAAGADWYTANAPITVAGAAFVKYGLPRILGVSEVARVAEYQGVPIFAETGARPPFDVLYVPVRHGCEFQPYQARIGG